MPYSCVRDLWSSNPDIRLCMHTTNGPSVCDFLTNTGLLDIRGIPFSLDTKTIQLGLPNSDQNSPTSTDNFSSEWNSIPQFMQQSYASSKPASWSFPDRRGKGAMESVIQLGSIKGRVIFIDPLREPVKVGQNHVYWHPTPCHVPLARTQQEEVIDLFNRVENRLINTRNYKAYI